MAVDHIIVSFSRDLIPKYCHGLQTTAVHSAHHIFVESLPGRSNRSLPRLRLPMDVEKIIDTFSTSNIYIALCLPKAITLPRLWSEEMFEVLLIIRLNTCLDVGGILNFPRLRDAFPGRLVRGITYKEGVP